MQPWTVRWTDDAIEQLADLWVDTPNRALVTIASDHIEQILAQDPRNPGKEASEGLWRIVVGPLVALFEMNDAERMVIVTGIGLLNQNTT